MAKIECTVEETLIEGKGHSSPGICVTCGMCDNSVEELGTDEDPQTIARALARLRVTCPYREQNRYFIPV